MECTNAVALVTGGAIRVGRAIALALGDAGCRVAVHYNRSLAEAEAVVETIRAGGGEAIALRGDLGDRAAPARLVAGVLEGFGRLDVLVNNASVFEPDPEGGFDGAHWQRMFEVNAVAPAALIASAEDGLSAYGCGKIVNICDIAADRPWKSYQAYCASKAALVSLTRSAARRLAPRVQVNGVSPGIAIFPDDYPESLRKHLIEKVPLGRAGTPEDIARAVRFLVQGGDYITGQIINVDGGRSIV